MIGGRNELVLCCNCVDRSAVFLFTISWLLVTLSGNEVNSVK